MQGINWDETALPAWERQTENRVLNLVAINDWEGALELLAERSERSIGSRLYYLETTILRQQERWEEARRCAYDGLYSLQSAKDEMNLLNLLRQAIVIDLHLGHLPQAEAELNKAYLLVEMQKRADQTVALDLDLNRLRLERMKSGTSPAEIDNLRQDILVRFNKLSERMLRNHPQLVREILEEFGSKNSEVLLKGLSVMTFGDLPEKQRVVLAETMAIWDEGVSPIFNEASGVLLREVSQSEDPTITWEGYFRESSPAKITKDVVHLLGNYADLFLQGGVTGGDKETTIFVEFDNENERHEMKGIDLIGGSITGAILDKL